MVVSESEARRIVASFGVWRRRALLYVRGFERAGGLDAPVMALLRRARVSCDRRGAVAVWPHADAVLAVFDDAEAALLAARDLRGERPPGGARARLALFWGDVLFGAADQPVGGEAQALRRLLGIGEAHRADAPPSHRIAERDRIVAPAGAVAELPEHLRAQFVPLGHYRLADGVEPIEVWTEALPAFLGREPTSSEALFGVDGLHGDTVLDLYWERRGTKLQRAGL